MGAAAFLFIVSLRLFRVWRVCLGGVSAFDIDIGVTLIGDPGHADDFLVLAGVEHPHAMRRCATGS